MMKFLFSESYKKTPIIGFDLDGTIYDEFEFVEQVYRDIVDKLDSLEQEKILLYMLDKWLEKGSSYPYIFKETARKFSLNSDFEYSALNIYRNFCPHLKLSERVKYILSKMKQDRKKMFLLTDGKEVLQNRKIDALNVRPYFNLIFVAEHHQKPDSYFGMKVIESFGCSPDDVAYIGDRDIDRKFADNCGFRFVYCFD